MPGQAHREVHLSQSVKKHVKVHGVVFSIIGGGGAKELMTCMSVCTDQLFKAHVWRPEDSICGLLPC